MRDKGWKQRSSFPRTSGTASRGEHQDRRVSVAAPGARLEETARRRLDALPLEAVVAQLAALEAGDLLALARHLRPRLVPGEESPAPAVAERMVRMSTEELRELRQRLCERLPPVSAEG